MGRSRPGQRPQHYAMAAEFGRQLTQKGEAMSRPTKEQLRALALSKLDQCRAIARDRLADIPTDDLICCLTILAAPRDFAKTFVLMAYAPKPMRELFAVLAMNSIAECVCDRLEITPTKEPQS
jgi:hypothetical protein